MYFCQFWGKMGFEAFANVASRQLGIHYEGHGYGRPIGLYTSVSSLSQVGKKAHLWTEWFQLSCLNNLLSDEGFIGR